MKVVVLCGGKGTRIRSHTDDTPKVLYEIGERPILWHILKGLRSRGVREFVLCLGHRAESVMQHFAPGLNGGNGVVVRTDPHEDWRVTLLDTGAETNTGGRVRLAAPYLEEDTFMVTYGDGLADIDPDALLRFHLGHGRLATVTAVRPWSQFGVLDITNGGSVRRFREKPRLRTWINGGFFIFNKRALDFLSPDSVLEAEPIQALAAAGEMMAYKHRGFWACMDTYKDLQRLNELWGSGKAAWKTWA